jgi:predicted dehydrogenase
MTARMPVTVTVVGAGNRGSRYASWVLANPDLARVVAVAEPGDTRRERLASAHGVASADVVRDWRELLDGPRRSDAVIIATQDREHVEPALAFTGRGYHVLLEKPIAPTEQECRRVAAAADDTDAIFAVCHVLLYTAHTRAVRAVVESGRIGDVISVQHLEPVGFAHQAHSYVRGNWARTEDATFMLLAKSCHDIDWLHHVVGRRISRVSSFGSLTYFTKENAPAGAAMRCVECPLQDTCAYSATTLYRGRFRAGDLGWPLSTVVDVPTEENVERALREGPYGRCVYHADNDVVDHQVVALEFDGGASGTFTMTGFNSGGHRRTRIFGSLGEIGTDGETIEVYEFATGRRERIDLEPEGDATAGGGHGGGDGGLMEAFITAVATGDRSLIHSGPAVSLASHLAVFAAERARLAGTVEVVPRADIDRGGR